MPCSLFAAAHLTVPLCYTGRAGDICLHLTAEKPSQPNSKAPLSLPTNMVLAQGHCKPDQFLSCIVDFAHLMVTSLIYKTTAWLPASSTHFAQPKAQVCEGALTLEVDFVVLLLLLRALCCGAGLSGKGGARVSKAGQSQGQGEQEGPGRWHASNPCQNPSDL